MASRSASTRTLPAWDSLTLTGGWTYGGAGSYHAGYYKDPEGVVHLVCERAIDRTGELERLSEDVSDSPSFRSQAAQHLHRHPRNVRVVPKSRDFH